MKLSNLQIPPPANWQDFESLCCDLWKEIWKDPNTKKHGRLGQEQQGVDVYGKPNEGKKWAGVQCKGKDNYLDKKVTEEELKAEVNKAKKFKPRISQFILATTGPKDAKMEKIAREITEAHRAKKLFGVDVWAWEDIVQELSHHPAVVRVHFEGLLENFETLEELKETSQAILESQSEIKESQSELKQSIASVKQTIHTLSSQQVSSIALGSQPQDAALTSEYQAELDHVRDLVNSHRYKDALEYANKLKSRIWHNAQAIVRYRLLTNIGASKLKLNEEEEAARLFIEAFQYNPDDEHALGNIALGFFLLNQFDDMQQTCKRLLEKNPVSLRAYFLLIETSNPDERIQDIIDKVPLSVRNLPEVAFAISQWAHKQGDLSQAIEWLESAIKQDKEDSAELKATLGALILESIMRNESTVIQKQLNEKLREEVKKAKDLLSSSWESVTGTDLKDLRPNWILNRGLAKKILGDISGAIEDIEIALSIEPQNPLFIKHRALLAKQCRTKQETTLAIELLRKIQSSIHTPEVPLILAETLLDDKRPFEAKLVIEEYLATNPAGELGADAKRLLPTLYLELGDYERARQLSQELVRNDSSDLLNLVVASQIERKLQNSESALSLLVEAQKLVDEATPPIDLMYLANEFFAIQEFEKAAEIYEKIADTDLDAHLTRRLLSCYYHCGKLDIALEICKKLRNKYGPLGFVSEMESFIYEEIDDLPKAKEVCEQYLAIYPDDFVMRLRLAVVWLRLKDFKEVDGFLESKVEFDSLTADTGLQLAQLYAARNQDLKWFQLMYELRRKFYGDYRSHQYYVIQFFRKAREDYEWLRPEIISVDSAVEIIDPSGKKAWYIIENRSNPDFFRNEINLSHPLAQALLSKTVGEKVVLTKSFLAKEEGEITGIKSKYIYALHESMELYETIFPDKPGLWKIRVSDAEDEKGLQKGFQVFLDQITRDHNRKTEAQQLYKEGKLTLGSVAYIVGSDILNVWSHFTSNPDVGVICCGGTFPERDQALTLLKPKGIKLVIDLITLMTIKGLDIADEMINHFGKFGIAQATIDELQKIIDDHSMYADRGFMSVGKQGDQFVREEITSEQVKEHLDYLQAIMKWIDTNAEVIPCTAALSMSKEMKDQLRKMMGEGSFNTILISTEPGHVLFSDDGRLRSLAKNDFGVEGTWTQAALMHLLDQGVIDRTKYNDSVIKLVDSNYYFTSIDPIILFEAAKRADWFPKHPYNTLLRTLEAERSDEESSLGFTAEAIFRLWTQTVIPTHVDKLIFTLLDSVTRGRKIKQFVLQLIPRLKAYFKFLPIDEKRIENLLVRWSKTKLI